jgi:uncharacterized membrane protein
MHFSAMVLMRLALGGLFGPFMVGMLFALLPVCMVMIFFLSSLARAEQQHQKGDCNDSGHGRVSS